MADKMWSAARTAPATTLPLWTPENSHIFREAADHDRFLVEVRTLTGRAQGSAERLARRLAALAVRSPFGSPQSYRAEWRRRYVHGWSAPSIRFDVQVRKIARIHFGDWK